MKKYLFVLIYLMTLRIAENYTGTEVVEGTQSKVG